MTIQSDRSNPMGRSRSRYAICVLEATGMFDTLLFLRSAGICKKTDLYQGIGRKSAMAGKLNRLEDAGLIVQETHEKTTLLSLTDNGRRVADTIESIREIIENAEVRSGKGANRVDDDSRPRAGIPTRMRKSVA